MKPEVLKKILDIQEAAWIYLCRGTAAFSFAGADV